MELSATEVWVMASAALVLLMTPGVAFLYGGMTRSKSTLNMMMMVFSSMGIAGVVWVLWGYSISAGTSVGQIFGNPFEYFGLVSLAGTSDYIGVGFSATFAMITLALIAGGIADRAKFSGWVVFAFIWVTAVYAPLAFMVWGGGLITADGFIGQTFGEAIDYAGGLVVHMNAGIAALVLALIIGKRKGFGQDPAQRPHNLPFVFLGAALLWFGWFGFNGGAASDPTEAGLIWVNTMAAPAAGMLAWLATERLRFGKPTSLGGASGIVAGLVGITPACASVSPIGAIIIGLVCGAASALAVGLKFKWGFDDSLDVVGLHFVSGLIGTVLIGFLALPVEGEGGGLFYGGGAAQLIAQLVATLVACLYGVVVTFIIAIIVHKTIGLRVTEQEEVDGVDLTLHAETAYEFGGLGSVGVFRPHPSNPAVFPVSEQAPDVTAVQPHSSATVEAGSTR